MKAQHLLRQALVAGHHQPRGTRAGVAEVQQVEQRRDVRLERALAAERLGEIEHERGIGGAKRSDHRHDVVRDRNARHAVAERRQRAFDLLEHRIVRRLRRIRAMEQGDVHDDTSMRDA